MLGEKMYPYFDDFLQNIIETKTIDISDIRAIRAILDEEIAISRDVIEVLIELDYAVSGIAEWREFLASTIADFVVWAEGPLGSVSAATSGWLITTLRGPTGVIAPSAADIVRGVIAEADDVDASLSLFALEAPCAAAQPSATATHRAPHYVM